MDAVLGVDGCRAGWVGVRLEGPDLRVAVAATIDALVAALPPVAVVAIDIPMRLPENHPREAEREARRRLPGRASTVFSSPAASALDAATYEEANARNRVALGLGLSRQAYGLFPAIRDVRDWLATGVDVPVVEAHPEVCFAAMGGGPVTDRKRTPSGAARRRSLLAAEDVHPPTTPPRGAALDDLLDAAAVAWTARRVAAGLAEPLGPDETGGAIWV